MLWYIETRPHKKKRDSDQADTTGYILYTDRKTDLVATIVQAIYITLTGSVVPSSLMGSYGISNSSKVLILKERDLLSILLSKSTFDIS